MIKVILPYDDAENKYKVWAREENTIDFRKDSYSAKRCTLSFAADELCRYLGLVGLSAEVCCGDAEQVISITAEEGDAEAFTISKDGNTITIAGEGRVGALYGVYELLEAQGIRWYSPWEEYIPKNVKELTVPECKKYIPSMPLGRGFDFEGPLKESKLLYLWMARNKLNVSTNRNNTNQFQRKLGMSFKIGGHIFEGILDPEQSMPTGRTMFEEHTDWYGETDEPLTAENALGRQFCVSNDELKEYLWQNILEKLNNEWYEADRVDIWGFDTWGKKCQCEKCSKLGNGADQMLHFISYLRKRMDETVAMGEFDHKVSFVMCAYEGTATLEPPLHGIPENLKESGDYVVYYPIIRCYEHTMADETCSYNKYYQAMLKGWKDIPLIVGEYYNVSKFEDLPMLFTSTIPKDLANYHAIGARGMTYMHLPMLEWGMRTITQFLYAKLCWNVKADSEKIVAEYYEHLYGELAETAKKAYDLTEEATKHSTSWRAWCRRSVLSALLDWDGYSTDEGLFRDDHLAYDAVEKGKHSAELLNEAAEMLQSVRGRAEAIFLKNFTPKSGVPVNPTDKRFKGHKNDLCDRISQDIRGLKYCIDVYSLTTYFVDYYEKLQQGIDTTEVWEQIRKLCLKMQEYCFSIKFSHPEPELNAYDALDRAGLKDLYYRCLSARAKGN